MMLDREQESLAFTLELTDPALALVASAREAEAARNAFLAAGGEGPDTADDAVFDALEVVPTTLDGVRAKIAMALDIEGAGWPDDVSVLLRSLLASPVLAGATAQCGENTTYMRGRGKEGLELGLLPLAAGSR